MTPNGWSSRGGQTYGVYCNRQDPAGSSSGSAVAARLRLAAGCLNTEVRIHSSFQPPILTTQNNGSISSPASRSAVVGLKPTVGLTSRYGVWPANPYQDDPGSMTKRVKDAAEILSVIAGEDSVTLLSTALSDVYHAYRKGR